MAMHLLGLVKGDVVTALDIFRFSPVTMVILQKILWFNLKVKEESKLVDANKTVTTLLIIP